MADKIFAAADRAIETFGEAARWLLAIALIGAAGMIVAGVVSSAR